VAENDREGGDQDMTLIQTWLSSLLHREEGQGLAEYALILALIAIVAILALLFLGTQISTILQAVGDAV
jgi:pilus assembly protein Flp/PilA